VEVVPDQAGAEFKRWIGGHYETMFSCNPSWEPTFSRFPEHPITRGVQPFQIKDEWYFNMRFIGDIEGTSPQAVGGMTFVPILSATPSDATRDGPYVYPKGPYPHIQAAKGRLETMMWAVEREDGGRGFGFTGGHFHDNWGNEPFRKVVLNALVWLAKAEVPANDRGVAVNVRPMSDSSRYRCQNWKIVPVPHFCARISALGSKPHQLQFLDQLVVLVIARNERLVGFDRGSGDHRIGHAERTRQAVLLHVNKRAVADIFSEWQRGEPQIAEKRLDRADFGLIASTLQQFHRGDDADRTMRRLIHSPGGFGVAPQHPDQDIGVKEHRIFPDANAAHVLRRPSRPRGPPTCQTQGGLPRRAWWRPRFQSAA
jgi:hypothetical protein